jgi:2-oxoglutarate dehydrogenase E2 component (dihydrolipoamide succinyltransferase)
MSVKIEVPPVGESVSEGVLARWLKPNGAAVKANEPLYELETDKATQEIRAPAAGTLVIVVPEGQKVSIGAVVGRIEEGAAPAPKAPSKAAEGRATPDGAHPNARPAPGEVLLSPAARQAAADRGVDVSRLTGTGRGGRVIKEDVLGQAAQPPAKPAEPAPAPPPAAVPALAPPAQPTTPPLAIPMGPVAEVPAAQPSGARETRQRMTTIRQRIAERLLSAQQGAAILTTFNEADLSAMMALRAKYKEAFQKKHGVGLGFMSFFVKAAVEALRAFPAVNARIDGADIVYHHYYNLGVAVSTEKGLMVPVLRDCERLGFAQVEKGIAELAQKAREGKITVADLQGGTFTITNGGVFGSLLSTPILNPPQSAILGMHAIQERPVAVDDQVVIRPMMYLALSYDHRIIDGREAVSFLVRVKECVENPERLLLEV